MFYWGLLLPTLKRGKRHSHKNPDFQLHLGGPGLRSEQGVARVPFPWAGVSFPAVASSLVLHA